MIKEQIVLGRDSLDDLNSVVNNYITQGYQPKDPMLVNRLGTDGQQYRYLQTMIKEYTEEPGDLGSLIVKYLKQSGIDQMINDVDDKSWEKFRIIIKDMIKEVVDEVNS